MQYILWNHEEQSPEGFFCTKENAIAAMPGRAIVSKHGNLSCAYKTVPGTYMEIFEAPEAPAYFYDCTTMVPFDREIEEMINKEGHFLHITFHAITRKPFRIVVFTREGYHFGDLIGFIFYVEPTP